MEKILPMWFRAIILTSIVILFGGFCFGVPSAFMGLSLVQFSSKFNTDVATVSKVFVIQNIAGLIGAISCGILFNHVNRQLAAAVLIILVGLAVIAFPLVASLPQLFSVSFLAGFTGAGYDTAQTVWIMELWGGNAAAYIQAQSFFVALGAFMSPWVIKPFLPAEDNFQRRQADTLPQNSASLTPKDVGQFLHVPFTIGGGICILAGFNILILYSFHKYEKPVPAAHQNRKVEDSKSAEFFNRPNSVTLIGLSTLFFGVLWGTEGSAFQFLPTFGRFTPLHLSEQEGALLLSAFAAAFTLGRGIGIGIVLIRVRPQSLLGFNFVVTLAGNCALLFGSTSSTGLVGGALLLGFGLSTVTASFFGYIERYLEVTNMVGSIFIAGGGMIAGLFPLVVGSFIERSPLMLVYANCFSLTVGLTTFLIIHCIAGKVGTRRPSKSEYDVVDEKDHFWTPILDSDHSD